MLSGQRNLVPRPADAETGLKSPVIRPFPRTDSRGCAKRAVVTTRRPAGGKTWPFAVSFAAFLILASFDLEAVLGGLTSI
jgi:hypothetical protein